MDTGTALIRYSTLSCFLLSSFPLSRTFFVSFFFCSCCSSNRRRASHGQSGGWVEAIPTAGEGRVKSILGGGTYNDKDQGVKNQCWEQETSIPQAVWGVGRGNSHRREREGEVNFRWQHLQRQSQRSRSHKRVLGKRMESQWSLNILVGVSS